MKQMCGWKKRPILAAPFYRVRSVKPQRLGCRAPNGAPSSARSRQPSVFEPSIRVMGPAPGDSDLRHSSPCLARALASKACDSDTLLRVAETVLDCQGPHDLCHSVTRDMLWCTWCALSFTSDEQANKKQSAGCVRLDINFSSPLSPAGFLARFCLPFGPARCTRLLSKYGWNAYTGRPTLPCVGCPGRVDTGKSAGGVGFSRQS
jgi:hypothetical protein